MLASIRNMHDAYTHSRTDIIRKTIIGLSACHTLHAVFRHPCVQF